MKKWTFRIILLGIICYAFSSFTTEKEQQVSSPARLLQSCHLTTIGLEEEIQEEAVLYPEEPMIRVCIKSKENATIYHKAVEVTCDTAFLVEGEEKEVCEAGEVFRPKDTNTTYRVIPLESGRLTLLRQGQTQGYRGRLEILPYENAYIVVNILPMEEYLYGVVPSEMPSSYPMEALKAQAICARSYAYDKLLHPAYAFADLDDSTSFQVYASIPEQESTNQAVEETKGQVLVDENGTLLETMYYSTSMGENKCQTEEQFRQTLLEEKEADWESEASFYRWTYSSSTTIGDGLWTKLSGENAHIHFYGEKETPFTYVKRLEITRRGTHMEAVECEIETDTGIYRIDSEYMIRKVLCITQGTIENHHGELVYGMDLLPSPYFVLDCVVAENRVVEYNIRGGGFGHGIGMSQNGAKEMAKRGLTCEEILRFYYR